MPAKDGMPFWLKFVVRQSGEAGAAPHAGWRNPMLYICLSGLSGYSIPVWPPASPGGAFMSIRNLHHFLFHPQSITVIDTSSQPHGAGETVLCNVTGENFKGAIFPANPKCRGHNRRVPNPASRMGFEIVPADEAETMFLRLRLIPDAEATPA
jgi:hypothetical protein